MSDIEHKPAGPPKAAQFVLVAAVLVALLMTIYAVNGTRNTDHPLLSNDGKKSLVRSDRIQAVYLDNGRVYFGRLKYEGSGIYVLKKAFFIREKPDKEGENDATQQVVSVREELTGPDSNVILNGRHIVQIQNLAPNSKVGDAIESVLDS